jgi:hypothetical protein
MFGKHVIDDASGPCRFNGVGVDVRGQGDQGLPQRPAAASRPGCGIDRKANPKTSAPLISDPSP